MLCTSTYKFSFVIRLVLAGVTYNLSSCSTFLSTMIEGYMFAL